MSTLHKANLPLLCELTSRNITARQLVADVQATGATFHENTADAVIGAGNSFPELTGGVRYRLGLIFVSEIPNASLKRVAVAAEERGAGSCHPEVALYLREKYSQQELLALINGVRPHGTPPIEWITVLHPTIRDCHGCRCVLGLSGPDPSKPEGRGRIHVCREFGDEYRNSLGAFIVRLP